MPLGADLLSKDLDRSTDPRDQIQNGFDQRAFSSSIRTDDSPQDASRYRQIDLPKHRFARIGNRQVGDFNGIVCIHIPPFYVTI